LMRKLLWFVSGAIALIVVLALGGITFVKTTANGFSARAHPSAIEELAAQTARGMALPRDARGRRNPRPNSPSVLKNGREHCADHYAVRHANDGSSDVAMGGLMYPPAPDMRKERTQRMTDGELF